MSERGRINMKKQSLLIILPLFLLGCGVNNGTQSPETNQYEEPELPTENTTDIAYDPEQPVVDAEEVDWIDIEVPDDTVYTTEATFMYRLTLQHSDVWKLSDPIIERREGEDWIDVSPEEGNPNYDYHEMESMPDVGMSVSLVGFEQPDEPVEHEVGEYRAIEIFIYGEGEEQEIVQIAIPFEVDEEVIPDTLDNLEFVEIELQELTVSPETESVTFTVTNYHNANELHGGEYYRLEYYDGETWEEITPVDAFIDIGYVLEPEDSHEFTHQVLAQDENELTEGNYHIRKEFYLVDGTENIISDDAEEIEIVVEFEVVDE